MSCVVEDVMKLGLMELSTPTLVKDVSTQSDIPYSAREVRSGLTRPEVSSKPISTPVMTLSNDS